MPLSLALPTPLEYFASLVQSDAEFPLFEAAVSLAQDEYPELSVDGFRIVAPQFKNFALLFCFIQLFGKICHLLL